MASSYIHVYNNYGMNHIIKVSLLHGHGMVMKTYYMLLPVRSVYGVFMCVGEATRYCDVSGEWTVPNVLNCQQNEFVEISIQVCVKTLFYTMFMFFANIKICIYSYVVITAYTQSVLYCSKDLFVCCSFIGNCYVFAD